MVTQGEELSISPPLRRASCGQQTGEARAKDSNGWFYHTVSAATPPDKRNAKCFHQDAGECQSDEESDSDDGTASQPYVWSVSPSRHLSSMNSSIQLERTREIAGNLQESILARISTLRALCDEGYILEEEYERCVE